MRKMSTFKYSEKELQKHLSDEHGFTPFSSYLKEIVYGGSDGIVTTFAVVAGFAGASSGNMINSAVPVFTVLLFGLANLFADGVSMALGNFLSIRADHDMYHSHFNHEQKEIEQNSQMEESETIHILTGKGFTREHAQQLVTIYKSNKKYWTEFMMTHELKMVSPEQEKLFTTSVATFFSFVTFGCIPIIPYIFLGNNSSVFSLSIAATGIALVLLGILRWHTTGIAPIRSISESFILGGVSAVIAFFVGTFFRL